MTQALGIFALITLGIIIWAAWQSQSKRPNPYTDVSGTPITPVVVIDLEMPFASMVLFLVKLVLAAIPEALIATFLFLLASALLMGLGLGLGVPARY